MFYLSFHPGPDRQFVSLPLGGLAYIRIVESELSVDDALNAAHPLTGEQVLNAYELPPAPRHRDQPMITSAIELLRVKPYQTSFELSRQLNEDSSALSSLLYRDMLKPNNRITRRKSERAGRGWEWYLTKGE